MIKKLAYLCLASSILVSSLGGIQSEAIAQENLVEEAEESKDESTFFDMSIENLLDINLDKMDQNALVFYGYLNANVERVFNVPKRGFTGQTETESDPLEWSIPNFHIYGSAKLFKSIDMLLNLAQAGEAGLEIRNAWGNFNLWDERLQVRLGKMYRRFDLFNEKLDQIPTFLGIEPPELFDKDHLLLPRTTSAMVHGSQDFSKNWNLSYALSTENGEGGPASDVLPLGWDVRTKVKLDFAPLMNPSFILGTSGYASSILGGKTTPSVSVGNGSPNGGVLNWMKGDNYQVFGGFLEANLLKNLVIQAAYWQANHQAERDPAGVLNVVKNATLLPAHRQRFLGTNASKANDALTAGDVLTQANYGVQTFYVRLGYTFETGMGTLTPYVFMDWMNHPEVISQKKFGGDNESGFADDGVFSKPSVGVVYRPIDTVALKLDASTHVQNFNGATNMYPEVRFDASWAWSTQVVK